ncbi:MAG TPA: 50S ribosomal protein L23 [Candidatus Nanopusillus sp.]|nr:50S ribosomal protein L23 [Candidatus Nanopusillus sp.]
MDVKDILQYPVLSEKAIRMLEKENKVVFTVHRNANKTQIKQAFEKLFNVKVEKVNTLILPDGRKKAYIKLKKDYKASDILSKLGLL